MNPDITLDPTDYDLSDPKVLNKWFFSSFFGGREFLWIHVTRYIFSSLVKLTKGFFP